jgi:hypothetical protein
MKDKFWGIVRLNEMELLEKYYDLFTLVAENPRIMPKGIRKKLGYSGRGKANSTILYHLQNMYEKKISIEPRLTLRPFMNYQKYAYICRRDTERNLLSLVHKIDEDPEITYALCLSSSDFFLISYNENLSLERYELVLRERAKIFTPLFPIPKNWKLSMGDAFDKFIRYPFEKGKLERDVSGSLEWSYLDWTIFQTMRGNVRMKFAKVAEFSKSTSKTVKDHFYKHVLPNCVLINYFFPKGFNNYKHCFLRISSEYEISIINALSLLPCTSYVYPVDNSIILILFHESIEMVLKVLEKMEKMAILDGYLMYNPLAYAR